MTWLSEGWPYLVALVTFVSAAVAVREGLKNLTAKVVAHEAREEAAAVLARTEAAAAAAAATADRAAMVALWHRDVATLTNDVRREFTAMALDLKDLRNAVAEGSTELGTQRERMDGLRRDLDDQRRTTADLRKDLDARSLRRSTDPEHRGP